MDETHTLVLTKAEMAVLELLVDFHRDDEEGHGYYDQEAFNALAEKVEEAVGIDNEEDKDDGSDLPSSDEGGSEG